MSVKAFWILFTGGGFMFCSPSQLPINQQYEATAEIVAHTIEGYPSDCDMRHNLQVGDTIGINGYGWCVVDSINYLYP